MSGQNKQIAPILSSPIVVVDIEADTIDIPKLMVWKEDIIKEHDQNKAFCYSEIQNEDSLSWFIGPNFVRCYIYNKNLPDLVLFKRYDFQTSSRNRVAEYGYFFDDHEDDMFFGYGTKIGKWKHYNSEGELYTEKDYDTLRTFTWYQIVEIATKKLKCSQKDLKIKAWGDDKDSGWGITDRKGNRYEMDAKTGEFTKLPKYNISVMSVE